VSNKKGSFTLLWDIYPI